MFSTLVHLKVLLLVILTYIGPKADKLPRPNISEGATDSDWIYLSDPWTRYKKSTNLTGQAAVDQLWACCSDVLAGAAYDGMNSHTDKSELRAVRYIVQRLSLGGFYRT